MFLLQWLVGLTVVTTLVVQARTTEVVTTGWWVGWLRKMGSQNGEEGICRALQEFAPKVTLLPPKAFL
ncbi:MAG: hypothetical protein ACPGWR_25205, partial [Ardenticatenaceae bacterium]